MGRFDVDALDEDDPFEVDDQVAHLLKHPARGVDDITEMWSAGPLFYPARPLAPSRTGDSHRCRPIGCYVAAQHLARRYLEDR